MTTICILYILKLAEYVDIMLICPKFQLHIPTNFSFFISYINFLINIRLEKPFQKKVEPQRRRVI